MTPALWPRVPLKRIIESVQSGTSVNGAPWPADETHLGVLKTSAVYGGVFNPKENKEVDSYDLDRVSCPVLAGSLIVSRMNTKQHLGVAAAVGQDFPNLYLPDRLWAVRFLGADPRFIDWWTKTDSYRAQVEAASVGTSSSMQNISQSDFLEIHLELPILETQCAIADYLDVETARMDTLIEEQQRLIVMLHERRRSIVDGEFGVHAPDSRLQSACVDVVDCPHTTPQFTERGEYEAVRTTSVRQGKFRPGKGIPVAVDTWRERNAAGAPAVGDILFTREAPAGEACMVPSDRVCLGQRVVLLRVDPDACIGEFLLWQLYSKRVQDHFALSANGSTVANVRLPVLRTTPIWLPDPDEQRLIATRLHRQTARIDTLIAETERFIELSLERRLALITAAVTGQIDVREAA